ncbi:right-handed parallel beta-helix repeat-containing protein [Arenibacter sp. BSSL-BM3]|uniref:Right-handed parallel beta-helix repeat-containing protein n=1 Tax=Arenibacter arenosicollis TaxID=2762274 RepID=A0ABR7QL10_9FLAO|nr:right-handed parallel beta-helix repeat-containing protein [Arenibacter arenosicollis]MBC8767876.1 right-handed parallel beta-helix repeat-containing protein [Arenibacter arenosicollis]
MKFHPSNFTQLTLAIIVLFLSFSCNKDSDLLAEYVVENPQAFMVNDVVVTLANKPVVIKPLSNDTFEKPEEVIITAITPPKMGTAEVQEDNTVVYTPNTDETGTDDFDYTTTVTNPDNSVSTETGSISVTVTPTDKTSPITGENVYYVTATGKSSNKGATEAAAWNIQHAFATAKAGDVVYIKAGNYGSLNLTASNSGTADNPIKFIGYTATAGDLVSKNGSTFKYGDNLDSNKMPLLTGELSKTAITVQSSYVEIENIQITKYGTAIVSSGENVVLRNIIATQFGTQTDYNAYDGRGLMITGDNSLIENVFVLNATAEAIKLYGSNNSRVNYCEVRADNPSNPTDYYFLLTGGTHHSIIENSHAERTLGLRHGGHGFDMKDQAEYNIIRNCVAKYTSFEFNFAGVRYNTLEGCSLFGASTEPKDWHANLVIFNGANNNLIKDMLIQDTWSAISWADDDDGYVGPGGDRDEVSCGYDNTFDGITIKNTNRILNVGGGTNYAAAAKRNTFRNCDFSNFDSVAVTYYPTEDIKFENCKFSNGNKAITEAGGLYAPYSKANITFNNCTWVNNNFTPLN